MGGAVTHQLDITDVVLNQPVHPGPFFDDREELLDGLLIGFTLDALTIPDLAEHDLDDGTGIGQRCFEIAITHGIDRPAQVTAELLHLFAEHLELVLDVRQPNLEVFIQWSSPPKES